MLARSRPIRWGCGAYAPKLPTGWFRWIHSDGRAPPASSQANTSLTRDRQAKARRLAVGFAFGCNGGRNEAKMEEMKEIEKTLVSPSTLGNA
jgi:hypothetical protein